MYTKHFDLNVLPFENVPDPKFFFDEGEHARVRSRITESFRAGRGLTVVTGPIGSGKTTLSQMVISDFSDNIKLIWMAEPPVSGTDLFLFIAQELGLKSPSRERVFVLRDIKDLLINVNSTGSKCLLIIDESHLMPEDVIDAIRILNNLEVGSTKLIQILLLGQEEFMKKINKPEMEPFRQRIATLEILGKMNVDRIRKYVEYRLHVAGGSSSLLSETGWEALALAFGTGSTPRVINSLCDRSFNAAFEREKKIVDVDDVYEAAQAMGLQKDIFFYKISLKKGAQEREVKTDTEAVSVDEPAASNETVRSIHMNHDNMKADNAGFQDKKRELMPLNPAENDHDYSFLSVVMEQKSTKGANFLLYISIAVFILSIFFFCERSASPDTMTCIQKLLSF